MNDSKRMQTYKRILTEHGGGSPATPLAAPQIEDVPLPAHIQAVAFKVALGERHSLKIAEDLGLTQTYVDRILTLPQFAESYNRAAPPGALASTEIVAGMTDIKTKMRQLCMSPAGWASIEQHFRENASFAQSCLERAFGKVAEKMDVTHRRGLDAFSDSQLLAIINDQPLPDEGSTAKESTH